MQNTNDFVLGRRTRNKKTSKNEVEYLRKEIVFHFVCVAVVEKDLVGRVSTEFYQVSL